MLRIEINGQPVQISASTKLAITLTSPVFSDSVFENNTSYNFIIPDLPGNRKILHFPGRIQTLDKPTTKNTIRIIVNGRVYCEGIVIIKNVNSSGIELVAGLNESAFYNLVGEKYITDLVLGGERQYRNVSSNDSDSIIYDVTSAYPDADFTLFPVKNLGLFDGSSIETAWRSTGYGTVGRFRPYQNDYFYDGPGVRSTNHQTVTPFPFVGYIVQKIFEENGIYIDFNVFQKHTALSKLVIYNPNIATSNAAYGEWNTWSMNNHLPKMKVAEFLRAQKQIFGIDCSINFYKKSISIKSFIDCKEGTWNNKHGQLSINYEAYTKHRFIHMSDENDSHWTNYVKPNDIANHNYRGSVPTVDFASITSPIRGDIALCTEDYFYYLYDYDENEVLDWRKYAYATQPKTVGESEDTADIDMFASGAINEYIQHDDDPVDYWAVPVVEVPGNYANQALDEGLEYRDFALKMMFAWGIVNTNPQNISYPVGSSTIYQYGHTMAPNANLSLFPDHTNSFVDEYLTAKYKALDKRRTVKVYANMLQSEIEDIDFLKFYLYGSRKFMVSSLKFEISANGFSRVEIEMIDMTI